MDRIYFFPYNEPIFPTKCLDNPNSHGPLSGLCSVPWAPCTFLDPFHIALPAVVAGKSH